VTDLERRAAPDGDGPSTIDPAAFDRLVEMTGGDREFVDELVDTYLSDGTDQIAAMHAALAAGDPSGLERAAHSLKSGSATVGAIALGERCRSLEEAARTGDVPDGAERVAAIAKAFDAAASGLRAERAAREGQI
jgi:HPt (histidine-containing phosphotransfer) domain-containing protein